MLYVVGYNEGRMVVNFYDGTFKLEEDAPYFRRLAEWVGAEKLIYLGEDIKLRESVRRIDCFGSVSLCVPYVWFSGDVDKPIELQCPFVNDDIFTEYLVPVVQLPNVFVPKRYEEYVGVQQQTGLDADVIMTSVGHPMMYSKGEKFSNFPGQFNPLVIEGMIFAMHKGLPCLYPVDGVVDTFALADYGRFLTLTELAEQTGYPFYKYDDKRSFVFYLPNLTETETGVFIDTRRGLKGDPFGIGIDTVKGVILK